MFRSSQHDSTQRLDLTGPLLDGLGAKVVACPCGCGHAVDDVDGVKVRAQSTLSAVVVMLEERASELAATGLGDDLVAELLERTRWMERRALAWCHGETTSSEAYQLIRDLASWRLLVLTPLTTFFASHRPDGATDGPGLGGPAPAVAAEREPALV